MDRGLTANARVYPFWGTFKGRFRQITGGSSADLRAARLLSGYGGLLTLAAAAMAIGLGAQGTFGPIWAVAALCVLAAVAERSRVRLSETLELSISLIPTLFAAVVFGPLAALSVAAAAMLADLPVGSAAEAYESARLRWIIYTASSALIGAATGFAAQAVRAGMHGGLGSVLAATAAGAVVSQVLDSASAALTVWLRRRGSVREVILTLAPVTLASVPLYAPVVALLAFTYEQVSPWTLPLFLVPTLAAHRLFALYQQQTRLAQSLVVANQRLEKASLSFASALVATLDARDRYTAGHSAAVAIYSRDIARRMSLSDEMQKLAHLCGLVHDIGKVGLSAGLLEKPGALTLEERRQMEEHSAIGERILARVEDYAEIATIVRHHHERVDGNGYPDQLADEEIPVVARIISVADAYNAMTSDRPYRDAMPSRVARLRLAQAVESQFDTSVVAAFEAILAGATEAYRGGYSSEFEFSTQEAAAESLSVAVMSA